MSKIKISMFALAFVLAAGASFATSTIQDGWYVRDYSESQVKLDNPPLPCNDEGDLCATHYTNEIADAFVYEVQ